MHAYGIQLAVATLFVASKSDPLLCVCWRVMCVRTGIMLWQLYTGAVPYAGMRYAEIVYKVAVCNLRPLFPTDCPKRYRDLAQACWNSDATARPTFEQVCVWGQALDLPFFRKFHIPRCIC